MSGESRPIFVARLPVCSSFDTAKNGLSAKDIPVALSLPPQQQPTEAPRPRRTHLELSLFPRVYDAQDGGVNPAPEPAARTSPRSVGRSSGTTGCWESAVFSWASWP